MCAAERGRVRRPARAADVCMPERACVVHVNESAMRGDQLPADSLNT